MEIIYQSDVELIIKFEKGEHYIESMKNFLEDTGIESGFFSGIGGFLEAELSYYDLDRQEYISKKFEDGPYEVASITGNVSVQDGDIKIHNHVVLGDTDYNSIAGHLENGVVGGTLEIYFKLIKDSALQRERDEDTGLDLLLRR